MTMNVDISSPPMTGSATRRRQARMSIRHALGVSHDPAPELSRVLQATRWLDGLMQLTTNGQYRIRIERVADGAMLDPQVTHGRSQ